VLIVSDVHGAFDALAEVASEGEPLLVLGDLLNFIDYRTGEGLIAEVAGRDFAARLIALRSAGDRAGSRRLWDSFAEGREDELRETFTALIGASYAEAAQALAGAEAYVTYGNADRPDRLRSCLPAGVRYVDGEVVVVEGLSVGFAGGGAPNLGAVGEVTEDEMTVKLGRLGRVDVLCTHVAPAVRQLSTDVVAGRVKESKAVLDYLIEFRPKWHYFGDIHQPMATAWRVGDTLCRNAGYFRATRRAVRHG
jgi:Icc-related predicted phosphoesterase